MDKERKRAVGLAGLLAAIGFAGGLAWWCWHMPWFRAAYVVGSLWVILLVFWYGISAWSRFGAPTALSEESPKEAEKRPGIKEQPPAKE